MALKNYSDVPKEDLNFEYAQFNYASLLYKNKQFSEALKTFKQLNYNKSNSYLLKCLYELNLEKELLEQKLISLWRNPVRFMRQLKRTGKTFGTMRTPNETRRH